MKTFSMKKLFFTATIVSASALVLLSCSGGGSGGGGSSVSSTLNEETIQVLSQNVLEEGDCIAVSGLTLTDSLNKGVLPVTDVREDEKEVVFREYPISYTVYGLLGGSVSKEGEHKDGTDSLTYKFDNFSNPSGNLKFGVSGQASVVDHGKPGDWGPIMSNKTIDTKGKVNVTKASYNRDSTANYECEVDGYNQIYATEFFSFDDLNIKAASAKNVDTGAEYKIKNLTSKASFDDSQILLTDIKTIYTDPKVGTVEVTSDAMTISRDSMQIPSSAAGTLVLTATDGTQAELVITQSGNIKVYTKDDNQRVLVSEMDCSGVVH